MQCTHTIQEAVVIKGKIWRSLDLANQSNVTVSTNLNNSPNNHPTSTTSTVTTATTNAHHNSLINANQTPHYQRHDFKNRRSSSEPANEQKLLAHIQSNSNNNTTTITNIKDNNTSINQTNSTNNSNSLVIDDASSSDIQNPSDDFIDCLHQKNIKVSNKTQNKFSIFSIFFIHYLYT